VDAATLLPFGDESDSVTVHVAPDTLVIPCSLDVGDYLWGHFQNRNVVPRAEWSRAKAAFFASDGGSICGRKHTASAVAAAVLQTPRRPVNVNCRSRDATPPADADAATPGTEPRHADAEPCSKPDEGAATPTEATLPAAAVASHSTSHSSSHSTSHGIGNGTPAAEAALPPSAAASPDAPAPGTDRALQDALAHLDATQRKLDEAERVWQRVAAAQALPVVVPAQPPRAPAGAGARALAGEQGAG